MTPLKVGDKVVRNDGYSRGLVVAVLECDTKLNPYHQVVIRQRPYLQKASGDTIVTRNLEGHSPSKYDQYQFVKEKKKVTVDRFYVHWLAKGSTSELPCTPVFCTLLEREKWIEDYKNKVNIIALTQETIKYEVDDV